jgi:hypothetical protein
MLPMLAYLPQHIAELWAVAFGVVFAVVGVIMILRADSASIYRDGVRVFSISEHPPGPASRPVSSAALRWIGGIAVSVGLFVAVLLSHPQTGCPICIEDPWGSAGWTIGTIVIWAFTAIYVGARIRHLFHSP